MTTINDLKPTAVANDTPAARVSSMVYGYLDQAADAYSSVSNELTVVTDSLRDLLISDCRRFYEMNEKALEKALCVALQASWDDIGRQFYLVREHGVAALDLRKKYLFKDPIFESALGFGSHSINLNMDDELDRN